MDGGLTLLAQAPVAAPAADATAAATAAAPLSAAQLAWDRIAWVITVPMVYAALLAMVMGIAWRIVVISRSPPQPFTLRLYPAARRPTLAALGDVFAMPQVRRHRPGFWVFLMLYHVAFLFLILSHLDILPGISIMAESSKHMLGWGAVGVVVTLSACYFLARRFRSPVREISVPADYLLLLLLLLTFFLGDAMSWSNSWGAHGFVMTKQDFSKYFAMLASFSFADPRAVLPGSHYHFVVLHVLAANLLFVVLPFSKVMHTFLSLPINMLRRR